MSNPNNPQSGSMNQDRDRQQQGTKNPAGQRDRDAQRQDQTKKQSDKY